MTVGFIQRLQNSGLSPWEMGDLLGIHPHQLRHIATAGLSTQHSIAVLIELSRRLDLHPADLIADLDTILTNRRLAHRSRADDHDGADHGGGADALVLLTALAHARTPLSVDDLARALGWPLDRVQAALGYAHAHPGLAGPMALRRVPPQTYTLTPRLDILAVGQQQTIRATTNGSTILAEDEAIVLLGALAYGHGPRYATFRDEDPHRYAEAALTQAGILHSDHGPDHVSICDDVLYSLRYRDDTHIARQRGEHSRPLTSSPRDH